MRPVPGNGERHGIHGLYAVTPDEPDTGLLATRVRAALTGGAKLIQYRNKSATAALRLEQAGTLLALCRRHATPLIINDDLDLVLEIDADGLHLGGGDGSIAAARAKLGPRKLIGASCYNVLQTALAAEREDADYVAFGSFFASSVKPGAVHASLALLREAKQRLSVPVVAIGGITLANAPQLIAAGANAVAVISALFAAPDVRLAAQNFNVLFDKQP